MPIYKTAIWSKQVAKQLREIPPHLRQKFYSWLAYVNYAGVQQARKISGFHDEPLTGNRHGQRSIRLNRSYRVIYVEHSEQALIEIIEVHKHDY